MTTSSSPTHHPPGQPSSIPVFRRVLRWSALVAVAVAVIGGIIGLLVGGVPGLVSAVIGAALTLAFAGITVVSVILAARFDPLYFTAIILGAWLLKFVLFLGVLLAIDGRPFIHEWVLWSSMLAGVLGTLAVDVLCVLRGRLANVSDIDLTPRDDLDAQ